MNALQASRRIQTLHSRSIALDRVIHYLDDEREFCEDIEELREMKGHIDREIEHLTEKLTAVKL